PVAVVEDLAFGKQQLAANPLVARRRVAGELDAAHEELLLLVEHQRQVHDLLCRVHVEVRLGGKVDVSVLAIQFGEAFKRLADLVGVENVAFLQRERPRQQVGLEDEPLIRIRTLERELSHVILLAFGDRNHDIGLISVPVADQRHSTLHVHRLEFLGGHHNLEIAVILVVSADAYFKILVQFGAVKRLAHHRNIGDAERNAVRPVVFHSADELAAGKGLVSDDGYRADLYLGALINIKDQLHGVGRGDALVGRLDGSELGAVGCEQTLDDHFGALDLRRIELAFHAEPDFFFLEGVENVGFGDRFISLVLDPADDRPLFHMEDDNLPVCLVRIIFHFKSDVLEKLGIPQSLKIAVQCFRIVGVAFTRKDAPLQRIALNPAVPVKFYATDDELRSAGFLRLLSPKGLATGER